MAVKRTEFSQALKAIATERGLDSEVVIDTIKQAYVAAYKRDARERGEDVEEAEFEAVIDNVTGEAKILAVDSDDPEKKTDVTPPGFGRIAAQTAKQVIHQKIREAEKGVVMDEFSGRVGSLMSGLVLRFDGSDVMVDVGRSEALMPAVERIPTERLESGQRLTFLLKAIEDTPRGKQIILSRADVDFVKKIFAREVPEIASGSVEIKALVREPGIRTKIAVYSNQPGVDPVGSCVGQKGVRVQSVTNELGGERVDIVPWMEDREQYLKAAFSPVEVLTIKFDKEHGEETVRITVPEDKLSLAIGRDGQNVRLTSQLIGARIEVEGNPAVKTREEEPKKESQQNTDET